MRYDPMTAPSPQEWLAAEEGEQLEAVLRYHKRMRVRAGNQHMHALMHTIIETQLAEGHSAACEALARLLREGLDRHQALHAVATVFSSVLYHALKGHEFDNAAYEQKLDRLTVDEWHRMTEQDGDDD